MNPYESPAAVEDVKAQPFRNTVSNMLLCAEWIVGATIIIGVFSSNDPKAFINAIWPMAFVPMFLWGSALAFHQEEKK